MVDGYILYNGILIIALVCGFLKKYLFTRYFSIGIFMVFWIPLAIRYGIGRDYFSYVEIYQNILRSRDGIEYGYYLLNYLISYFFNLNYQFIFAITSFVTILLCVKSFDKKYTLVSIILFTALLYLQSFSIIRQMLSVSLCLYGCSLWMNNKKKLAFLLFIIAPTFHFSAIIIIFIAIISLLFAANSLVCFVSLTLSIIFIFIFIFIFVLGGIDFIFLNHLLLNSKYGYYVTSAFNRPTHIGSGIGVFITLLLPLMIFIKASKIYENNKNNNLLLCISIVYLISYLLSLKVYIFSRLTDALSFTLILLVPIALKNSDIKGIYHKVMLVVVVFHIILFEANLKANTIDAGNATNSGLGIMPYSSILNTNMLNL